MPPLQHVRAFGWVTALMLVMALPSSAAGTLESESFRQLGGSFSSMSSPRIFDSDGSPSYLGSGAALGEGVPGSMSGSSSTLESVAPGFWAIAAGSFPSLDVDLDGIQTFLDDDDDNDGLLDAFETGTMIFVSATNTGSSPNNVDSDGDGIEDGVEVLGGSDPNDPGSTPSIPVPALSRLGWIAAAVTLILLGGRSSFSRRRRFQ
jgi:Bacterial TSP3 repeat